MDSSDKIYIDKDILLEYREKLSKAEERYQILSKKHTVTLDTIAKCKNTMRELLDRIAELKKELSSK